MYTRGELPVTTVQHYTIGPPKPPCTGAGRWCCQFTSTLSARRTTQSSPDIRLDFLIRLPGIKYFFFYMYISLLRLQQHRFNKILL